MRILGIVGSLRTGSYNRALFEAARARVSKEVVLEEAQIGDLPLFNQDVEEAAFPKEALRLKEQIRGADGVLLITPEFNRSIPGPLKNAIDWSSRPETEPLVWRGKPVWVIGASSGPRGTVVAQYDLKRIMIYFGARLMPTPEFYLGDEKEKFDAAMVLTDQKTKDSLAKGLELFVKFIGT